MPKKTNKKDKKNFLKIFGSDLTYLPIRKSCKESGIGKSTFYRWLKDKDFKKEIEKIKKKRRDDPMQPVKTGNVRAVIRFLRKYGKSRGY